MDIPSLSHETARPIRLLGLGMQKGLSHVPRSGAKNGGLFDALHRRYHIVGMVCPHLSRYENWLYMLRYIHPDRELWVSRAGLNPDIIKRRSAVAEQQLQPWEGHYDVIFQLHATVAPGVRIEERPYVIFIDNTGMLSLRHYPPWAPLRGRQLTARINLDTRTYQHAAFLFPMSEFARRSLIDDYGCDPQRVIRAGGGVNFIAPSLAAKRYDKQVALFVGNAFKRKGGFVLLKAWEHVRQRLPRAELWVVGPKTMPHEARRPGVRWFGRIEREHVQRLLMDATLFVMPSLFEPWGFVFHEAMGHGLPCIGANHCAMPEIIAHHETGLLVPPGEPEPLAEALIALLNDPQRAATLGQRGYAEVVNHHTWHHVVQRIAPSITQAAAATTNR